MYSAYLYHLTEDCFDCEVQLLEGLKGLIRLYNSPQKSDSANKDGLNRVKAAPIYS